MKLPATIRAALVIGRRDFTATVFSKAFLFFLLGPLFPIVIGLLFGGIGANVAKRAEQPRVAIVAYEDDMRRLEEARQRVNAILGEQPGVEFVYYAPQPNEAALRRQLLSSSRANVVGVLTGGLFLPRFTGSLDPDGSTAKQLRLIVGQAQVPPGLQGQPLTIERIKRSPARTNTARALTAHAGQALLFLLTLLLAGMLLSQLIEEKSNKVIEVLAAAVPVNAIFLGKLFAMLAMSIVGIAVWATAATVTIALVADSGTLAALPAPALGWQGFALMGVIYFAFGYLLIGAAFLGIGAQASTVREVQTLSMPITMSQVVIFAIAAAAASNPDSPTALFAAVFPLSSPYAMLARAALDGRWWPHLLAIAWQMLWVALILRVAAAYFRRSVLKSGPQRRGWLARLRRREPRPTAATTRP
jgi:ABC-2 type transport system permease protein